MAKTRVIPWASEIASQSGLTLLVADSLAEAFQRGALRAARHGRSWTLTREQLIALAARSGGRCEVTGIPFARSAQRRYERQPFAASIDRIDSTLGYDWENCRLVCIAVNAAMNTWGEEVLRVMAVGLYLKGNLRAAVANERRKQLRILNKNSRA